MSKRINIIVSVFLVIICSINICNAQKVGVVLSGGGAKGMYHIGVLKALEDNNIPIDNITGTSMGAIVGAMYSSGMTIKQIEDVFCSGEVTTWLSGKIEMKYQNYYRIIENDGSVVSLDMNLRKILYKKKSTKAGDDVSKDQNNNIAVSIQENLLENTYVNTMIPSLQLDLALMEFFAAPTAAANYNFDSLFVPYRCVSVDIIRRTEHLWSKGDLGKAVRSSMAIPFVFSPIVVDSLMMYDGGILNNFPWKDNLREFNSDFLIGSICVSETVDPSSLTGQMSLIAMEKTDYNLPDSIGIKIQRDVGIGYLDYAKAKEVVKLGYDDAMLSMPELKRRVKREVTKEELVVKRRKFNEKVPVLAVDEIEIVGLNKRQTEYVKEQLNFEEGAILSFEDFKREYFKIIEGEMIAGGFPTAIYNPLTGHYKIYMSMTARHSFNAMAGINISSTNINAAYLGFSYSRIGKYSSNYMASGYLGNFYSAAEVSARQNFYAKKLPFYINSTLNYAFQDYGRGNNQRSSFANRVFDYSRFNGIYLSSAIGFPLDPKSKLEFRTSIGQDKYDYDSYNSSNPQAGYNKNRLNYATISSTISRNSLNYKAYATRGIKQSINLLLVYGSDEYTPGFIDISGNPFTRIIKQREVWFGLSLFREKYTPVSTHFTLGYSFEAIYTSTTGMSSSYATKLVAPGFYPTEHSHTLFIPEYHNTSYAAVGVKPIIEWNDNLYMKNEFYLFYPDITKYEDVIEKLRYVFASSIVYQSPIGPISLNYSHYSIKNSSMAENYVTLNIGFMLFKNRGIKYF